jgi:hypothetical protein
VALFFRETIGLSLPVVKMESPNEDESGSEFSSAAVSYLGTGFLGVFPVVLFAPPFPLEAEDILSIWTEVGGYSGCCRRCVEEVVVVPVMDERRIGGCTMISFSSP